MTKSNSKRNVRGSQENQGFKICKQPMVCLVPHETPLDAGDHIGLNHAREQPFLFAIARDARTIFASWNVDWRSIFEKTVPADQQVHLRLIGGDGAMERKVAVEPMAPRSPNLVSQNPAYKRARIVHSDAPRNRAPPRSPKAGYSQKMKGLLLINGTIASAAYWCHLV